MQETLYCPLCGTELEFDETLKTGEAVYACPDGHLWRVVHTDDGEIETISQMWN
jgi:uncharacterized Zn finger protein